MVFQQQIQFQTQGKGTYPLAHHLEKFLQESSLQQGIISVFVAHTSASLVLMENADPSARHDLEEWFERNVAESTPWFTHTYEGTDDMPSHIRMALTRSSEQIPVTHGKLLLGTWQGLFLFEHRRHPHTRKILFTALGE